MCKRFEALLLTVVVTIVISKYDNFAAARHGAEGHLTAFS